MDPQWLASHLKAARPSVIAALTRTFRDMDEAEDLFQEACLRALRTWPDQGPPRDPVAWLILVARNIGVDARRKKARHRTLPGDAWGSGPEPVETMLAEYLDHRDFRDDVLRLLFTCCHPCLSQSHQVALALT